MPLRKEVREGRAVAIAEISDRLFRGDDVLADDGELARVLRYHGLTMADDFQAVAVAVFERMAQRWALMPKPQPTDEQYRDAARALKHRDGEIEVDADAVVSADRGPDHGGAYVAAWVWVSDDEARA